MFVVVVCFVCGGFWGGVEGIFFLRCVFFLCVRVRVRAFVCLYYKYIYLTLSTVLSADRFQHICISYL